MRKEPRLLRVGVLGCGPISQFAHLEACRKARNAELYAICDVAEDLVEKMAAFHAPQVTYTDYRVMLSDPNVEAVIVGVADQFHVPAAREAIDPGIAFAQRFVREQMGEMLALKAWYCDSLYRYAMTDTLQPIPLTSGKARRPEGDPKADRRSYYLMAHGSHLLDTARFLGGEIVGMRARLVEKFGAHCWFAEAEFADGSVGHLDLTIAVRMDWHEGFQVYGEYGSVIGKTYNPWYLKSSDVECFSTRDGQYYRPLGEDAHFFRLQVEGFADRILGGALTLGADVDDGLAAVRGLVALARSAESGKKVLLSEAEGGI